MELSAYSHYNSSFRSKFIYRLGGSTGFFSEYNNMVLAIHYCIVNRIQFVLESEEANFSYNAGWIDFFLPFCKEIKSYWLRKFNYRRKPVYKNRYERICFNLFKLLHPSYIYMYTLFGAIRKVNPQERFIIPELGLSGTLLENCREIHQMIWRYNESTSIRIHELISGVQLPEQYVGIHIRLGDKIEEAELYSPIDYVEKAKQFSSLKSYFVLTDDYRAIINLTSSYPDISFYTLCHQEERGYHFQDLMSQSVFEKTQSFYRLWASMDILGQSVLFVGTYSANPGMNIGFRLEKNRIKCLDYNDWQLW